MIITHIGNGKVGYIDEHGNAGVFTYDGNTCSSDAPIEEVKIIEEVTREPLSQIKRVGYV